MKERIHHREPRVCGSRLKINWLGTSSLCLLAQPPRQPQIQSLPLNSRYEN